MSNEIRENLKSEIDKITHDWLLQTHDQFELTQEQMASLLNMDRRSYAAIESKQNSCGLLTFLIYLFNLCPAALTLLIELSKKIDEFVPAHPEMVTSREWMYREMRWTQKSVQTSPITKEHLCPECGAPIARDFQNYCGSCGQALNWNEYAVEDDTDLKAEALHA